MSRRQTPVSRVIYAWGQELNLHATGTLYPPLSIWRTARYVFNCIRNVNLRGNLGGLPCSKTNIANFFRAWQVIWKFEHSERFELPNRGFAGPSLSPAWRRVHI